jgi:glycosyltransferase involved in cell wall biosynthesis
MPSFRVGVVAMETTDTNGGSYTFQREIVNALLRESSGVGIEWVLIAPKNGVTSQLELSPQTIQSVEISLGANDNKTGLIRNWFSSHLKSVFNGSPFKDKSQRRSEFFERELRSLHLSMIWYLGPHPYTREIPYALTVWDIQHRIQPWFPEISRKGIWVEREVGTAAQLQQAVFLITGNNVGAGQISSAYSVPLTKIIINPLPAPSDTIEYKQDQNMSKTILNWRKGIGEFILYPAQFWPHKNHKVLLEAIAHLAATSPAFPKLVFTGSDKGNLKYIREIADELQVNQHVINLGFVDRQDLLYLYSQANALVFPSMFGPDNIPPLEAMALGCPVIVADEPGMREQLEPAAIFLSPTEPIEWAEAITALSQDAKLRETLITLGKDLIQYRTTEEYITIARTHFLNFKKIRETWPVQ